MTMSHATLDAPRFDQERTEAFMEKIADTLNAGAVSIMLSIGHRSGLLDCMETLPPSSAAAIAEASGLAERYVREWLAALVVGGVIEYDPRQGTYSLPAEHAACLTRSASPGNLAVYAQVPALLGSMQERILQCFKTGEGTAYEEYPCFHQFMAEDSGQTVVASLLDSVLPLVPGLIERLEAGIDVLDAGCARGLALQTMAERFPASRFVGYDLCADAIAHATESARDKGLDNIRFETRDLTGFDERERYDFICSFDAVHDQKDPQALLESLHRALRPGGVYLMQDIGGSARLEQNMDFPMAPMLYAISCMHCTPISLGQGGAGLGTMWGWETAEAMLNRVGFKQIVRNTLEHDPMNVWFVSRKA